MNCQDLQNFYPKKFYRFPFLMRLVNELHEAEIKTYLLIFETLKKHTSSPAQVFTVCLNKKESCLSICYLHRITYLLITTVLLMNKLILYLKALKKYFSKIYYLNILVKCTSCLLVY